MSSVAIFLLAATACLIDLSQQLLVCGPRQFQCVADSSCIEYRHRCDGTSQCNDDSDETECDPCASVSGVALIAGNSGGVITSLNYPDNYTYASEIQCTWYIEAADAGHSVRLTFEDVCFPPGDAISVMDADKAVYNAQLEDCAVQEVRYFWSDKGALWVYAFVGSNTDPEYRHAFKLTYDQVPTDCLASTTTRCSTSSCQCCDGYSSTEVRNLCAETDECLLNNGGCHQYANCTNTIGSFTCTCDTGYTGDGFTCDIDECLENNGGCNANASCTNTVGSFTCKCHTGFAGDGFTCTPDVDECLDNNGGCSVNAACINTVGSFTCKCNTGFTGNGFMCTKKSKNSRVKVTVKNCRKQYLKLKWTGRHRSHKKLTRLSKPCIHKLCKKSKTFKKEHPMKC